MQCEQGPQITLCGEPTLQYLKILICYQGTRIGTRFFDEVLEKLTAILCGLDLPQSRVHTLSAI